MWCIDSRNRRADIPDPLEGSFPRAALATGCRTRSRHEWMCTLPQHPPTYPHIASNGEYIRSIWWEALNLEWRSIEPTTSIDAPEIWPRVVCNYTDSEHGFICSISPHPMGFPHIATGGGIVVAIWLESEAQD